MTTSFSPCKSRKTTEKCQKMPKKSRKKRRSHKFKKPGSVPLKAVLLNASKSARVFFRIRLIDSFLTCDTRGIQDLNAGPGVGLGWVVGLAVRRLFFFFDLPIFGPKNSLETPHKPLSHSIRSIQQVSCCKTDKGSNDSDLSVCNCCCR